MTNTEYTLQPDHVGRAYAHLRDIRPNLVVQVIEVIAEAFDIPLTAASVLYSEPHMAGWWK